MRCSRVLGDLMCSATLLLPLAAVADSQLQGGSRGPVSVSAHLRFRIIIPAVLSLDVADGAHPAGVPTVAVMSTSRTVSLGATGGTSVAGKSGVILSAAAGRIIAQDAPCSVRMAQNAVATAEPTAPKRLVCTVSMP